MRLSLRALFAAVVALFLSPVRHADAAPPDSYLNDGVPTVITVTRADPRLPGAGQIDDPDGVVIRIERGAVLHGRAARWANFAPTARPVAFVRVEAFGEGVKKPLINAAVMLSRLPARFVEPSEFSEDLSGKILAYDLSAEWNATPAPRRIVGVARYDLDSVLRRTIPSTGIEADPSLPIRVTRAEADSYRLTFDPAVAEVGQFFTGSLDSTVVKLARSDRYRYYFHEPTRTLYIRVDVAGGKRPGVGGEPEWHVGVTSRYDTLWNYQPTGANRAGRLEFEGLRFANDWRAPDGGRRTINMQPGDAPRFVDCEFLFCGAGDDVIASAGNGTVGDHVIERCQFVGHGSDGGTMTIFDATGSGAIGRAFIRDNVHHAQWDLRRRVDNAPAGLVSNGSVGVLLAVHAGQGLGGVVERNIVLGLRSGQLQPFIQYTPQGSPTDPFADFPLVVQDNWIENCRHNSALKALLRRNVIFRGRDAAGQTAEGQYVVAAFNPGAMRLENNVIAGAPLLSLVGVGTFQNLVSRDNVYVIARPGGAAIGWFDVGTLEWVWGDAYIGGDTVIAAEVNTAEPSVTNGNGGDHVKWLGTHVTAGGPPQLPASAFAARIRDLSGVEAGLGRYGVTFVPAAASGPAIGKVWPTHPAQRAARNEAAYRAAFPADTETTFALDPAEVPGAAEPIDAATMPSWDDTVLPVFDPAVYFPPAPDPCRKADLAPTRGVLDAADIASFLAAYSSASAQADLTADGLFDVNDVIDFVVAFGRGCP